MLRHKGYVGRAEIDAHEKAIVGRVINMARDGITFGGKTVEEAEQDFRAAVDEYLAWAQEKGFAPERPYRGEILVRATAELHRETAAASAESETSINQFVLDAVRDRLKKARKAGGHTARNRSVQPRFGNA